MLTNFEKGLARLLQKDLPLERRPYAAIGKLLGVTEQEVIQGIRGLRERGVIRKVGAILRHRQAGIALNAMVMWAVPEENVEEAGERLAAFTEITHCYERQPSFEGKYNLFTMVHLKKGAFDTFIGELAREIGTQDFMILESEREFKKSSMEYF